MAVQNYTSRGTVPQQLDLKKLPPGHMRFTGGTSDGKNGLIIAHGHPYSLDGALLPADINQLRDLNYVMHDGIALALARQQPSLEEQRKNCIECSTEIRQDARFCQHCGTPQGKLWAPGDPDPETERIAAFIDREDPLGSLDILNKAKEPAPRRKTPDQIFADLQAGEENRVENEITPGLSKLGGSGTGKATYGDTEFGKIDMSKKKK